MHNALWVTAETVSLLQATQLGGSFFRDDLQDLPLSEYFHWRARLQGLVKNGVDILPQL